VHIEPYDKKQKWASPTYLGHYFHGYEKCFADVCWVQNLVAALFARVRGQSFFFGLLCSALPFFSVQKIMLQHRESVSYFLLLNIKVPIVIIATSKMQITRMLKYSG
jgi:hypothetical protein